MATIAQFAVELLARTQGFRRDMQAASQVVQGFGRTLATIRSGIIGFVGFGGLQSIVQRSLQTSEQLNNLAIRFGENTERLGRLRQVVQEAGLDFNQVTTAVQRLARRSADARQGNQNLAETFAQLGIDVEKFFQLAPIDQFAALATALSKVGDQGERIRLAFQLVDSEGVPAILRFTKAQNQLTEAMARAEAGAAAGRAAGNLAPVAQFFRRLGAGAAGLGAQAINQLFAPGDIAGAGVLNRPPFAGQRGEERLRGRGLIEQTLQDINTTSKAQLRALDEINAKSGPARAQ